MKFGYFDGTLSEYVIAQPNMFMRWINYRGENGKGLAKTL